VPSWLAVDGKEKKKRRSGNCPYTTRRYPFVLLTPEERERGEKKALFNHCSCAALPGKKGKKEKGGPVRRPGVINQPRDQWGREYPAGFLLPLVRRVRPVTPKGKKKWGFPRENGKHVFSSAGKKEKRVAAFHLVRGKKKKGAKPSPYLYHKHRMEPKRKRLIGHLLSVPWRERTLDPRHFFPLRTGTKRREKFLSVVERGAGQQQLPRPSYTGQ